MPTAAITTTTAATTNAGDQRRRENDSVSDPDSKTPNAFTSSFEAVLTFLGWAADVIETVAAVAVAVCSRSLSCSSSLLITDGVRGITPSSIRRKPSSTTDVQG